MVILQSSDPRPCGPPLLRYGPPGLRLLLPPNRLSTRGPGPPNPGSGPSPPPPPRCHLPWRQEWGRGEEERSRGGGFGPGRLSAPGGRGRGQRQRRRSVSPRRRQRRRRRRPTPAGTHRLHCPPAPPPFRLPPPGTAPSPSPRPSPSCTAPRKVRPAPPRTRAEKCPLPRPRRPARRGMGTAPPRLGARPRRREGPAPSRGMSPAPLPERVQWYQPSRFLLPLPRLPAEAPPPLPAHQVASPPRLRPALQHFTMGPPYRHHLLVCMDTPTKSPSQPVTGPEVTPTPHLKAAEPSFSTKRTSQRAGGVRGAAGGYSLLSRTLLFAHTHPDPPPPSAALGANEGD
ncbi:extensin-like [Sciurus carolinensis]|uniref:extensin-like n=1 Tax=Sciurus carolinensis TaxID=30640 RepID=UPI001FB4FF55|nr:extensin-like [Sciurus carolinensis]